MKSIVTRGDSSRRQPRFLLSQRRALTLALITVLGGSVLIPQGWQRSTSAQELQPSGGPASGGSTLSPTLLGAGALDQTFGVDGTVSTDMGNALNDSATAVAVQPDGKVIAVGYASTNANGKDFAVVRLNPNGVLDTTFSGDGLLVFDFNSAARDDIARSVAIQPNGKIIIAGEADISGFGNFDVVVARLNTDGSFDASFGSNGKASTNLPNNRSDYGRALALQSDGKILVAGYSNRPTTGDDFIAVRYNSNGSLDTTFDGDGFAITDVLTNREDRGAAMVVQPDGKIIVSGYTDDPSFKNDFATVRYNANGSLDSSFNGTGKVTTDLNLNSIDFGNAVTLQTDGAILVAGQSAGDFGLVRYASNGSLDMTFGGGDGIVTTNFASNATDIGRAVVVQTNGKITVAGRSSSELAFARYNNDGTSDNSFDLDGRLVQNAGNNFISGFGGYWGMALQADGKIVAAGDGWREGFGNEVTVSRLNANGTFDFSFGGGDGITTTDINGRFDEARSVAIQPNGKIVMAGAAQNSTGGSDVAVARYNTDGTLDTSFDGNGIAITDIQGHPDEGAWAVAIQPDGKILVAGKTDNALDGNVDDGVLIRYNSNGSLDTGFGSGGISILTGSYVTSGGLAWIRTRSVALQSDGRIVVAGEAHYVSVHSDGFVARYNANGILDVSFGSTVAGVSVIAFNTADTFNSVAIQGDGKIIAAGSADSGTSAASSDFFLARLTTSGVLDTSFDGDGKVLTNFPNNHYDAAYDLVIQPDGKVIAVGETIASGTGSDFAVARYNSNGSLDTTFGGGDGLANIDYFTFRDYCSGVALQPDGKIILAGFVDAQIETGYGVIKLNPNGSFDTSFGGGAGKVRTLFGDAVGSALEPAPNDVALQANGKIVVAGKLNMNSTDRDFAVVRYQNDNSACIYALNPASATFGSVGGSSSFSVTAAAACEWAATSNNGWISVDSGASGSGNGMVNFTVAANTGDSRVGSITFGELTFTITQAAVARTVQFSTSGQAVSEAPNTTVYVDVLVTRTGDTSPAATVDYVSANGTANDRSDYLAALGTLHFAGGETSKIIPLFIVNDSFGETPETFSLSLTNPVGCTLGSQTTFTITINSDESVNQPNPVKDASFNTDFFVRQHYLDFFNREPDAGGLAFWKNQIDSCATQECREIRRINVSAAFFLSIEFQQTGYLVERLYKTAYGSGTGNSTLGGPHTLQVPIVRLSEFLPDTQAIGRGVVIGAPGADALLEANKQAFIAEFVQRARFTAAYPGAMTAAQFVDTLNTNAGGVLSTAERNQLVSDLTSGAKNRGQVLRTVAENSDLFNAEQNRAFVLVQFFGYLRRDPNVTPDSDYTGYDFWLGKLNQFNGNFVNAEMVKAFILSGEYQGRFGP